MAEIVSVEPAKGRSRKDWKLVAVESVADGLSLRKAGQQWFHRHNLAHKPLTQSSDRGKLTLIGRCHACNPCTRQHCFSWTEDGNLKIEMFGEHSEKKNISVRQLHHAKTFARHTPGQALKLMRREKIPEEELPTEKQLKNLRHKLKQEKIITALPLESFEELKGFVSNPPENVRILEDHVCLEEDRVMIPFCLANSDRTDEILMDADLNTFLLDYTFNCCKEGLLVGSCGPVGLRVDKRGPSMRFLPVVFMVSTAEDGEAQQLLFNLWLERCHSVDVSVDIGFFDCSCFQSVSKACKEANLGIQVRRCLQHVSRWDIFEVFFCESRGWIAQIKLRNDPEFITWISLHFIKSKKHPPPHWMKLLG